MQIMAHRFSKEELDEQFEEFLKEVCLRARSHPFSPLKHRRIIEYEIEDAAVLLSYDSRRCFMSGSLQCHSSLAKLNSYYPAVLKLREQFCD